MSSNDPSTQTSGKKQGANEPTDPSVPPTESGAQVGKDPQLREVHEAAQTADEESRGNETSIDDGGARHRTQ